MKTLSELKREITVGTIIKVIHDNAIMGNICGMKFCVTHVTTRGFYYISCESENVRKGSCYDYSLMNNGKGAYMEYGRANCWEFGGYSMKYDYNRKRDIGNNDDIAFIIMK